MDNKSLSQISGVSATSQVFIQLKYLIHCRQKVQHQNLNTVRVVSTKSAIEEEQRITDYTNRLLRYCLHKIVDQSQGDRSRSHSIEKLVNHMKSPSLTLDKKTKIT